MTPGTQLTYLPDRASWFLWSPQSTAPESDAPAGAAVPATMRLAIPDGGEIVAREVSGLEVGLREGRAWLRARRPAPQDSDSLRTWTRLARHAEVAAPLPVAAHCALSADGAHIHTAGATTGRLRDALDLADSLSAAGLTATLRGYQLAGLQWLTGRERGAILADDMGLGKTIQAIALMLQQPGSAHLVICPTSVSANWEREITRHTPGLRVVGHREEPRPGTVTITTYARLRRDPGRLTGLRWGVAAFDEAQQIKNPRTLAYRTAKAIPAGYRLAITGTPVENELGDLWALGDLVSPGFLGTRRRFHDRYVVPIQHRGSSTAADRLAALTGDLVLRRTKTEVAPELPPREVIDVACTITAEQRRLYERALTEAFDTGLGSGAARRTTVLALLTRLKQICNHPALVLGEQGPLPERSGKFDRLGDMLDEVIHTGTGCLVFTQYTAMGRLLAADLADRHGLTVPFLHGGLRPAARNRIVEEFQASEGPSILVLSLRAAGFGLNLTRATTVVHYDRWWNPAVEDQASDRAHRIGQDQPVTIYTLRTAGTVEDHIATMHQRKRGLAQAALSGGEADLLALDDDELYDILRLSPQAQR
ncbi:DEAD/DEAH box helicase [Rhodococcus ruber]|uniref:DEAD/DEAH box helicase n=1 Tax=Rhodococcus ruber TaxID=1830 RepID=UPI0017814A64|nr:DEAD/DEAH box helicase [Rhodococcus ruber]MBD8057307.1 DEAD/DEAH box helicase [Rhodococcus ruber]MCF8786743.1 DEAD/DEAH box helicase [Rhodococcus ruber]